MIWFIIIVWELLGIAGAFHAIFAIRRSLIREYPSMFKESDPIYDVGSILVFLCGLIGGPLLFIATFLTYPKDS
jgi:uncharacterized membrane protein